VCSWKAELDRLEADLPPNAARFQVHESLPVAILRYDPDQEWELRRQLTLLGSRLEQRGRRLARVSLAEILWDAIDRDDPPDAFANLCALEQRAGFDKAQEQAGRALTPDTSKRPRAKLYSQRVADRLAALDPARDIAFLVRAAALGPGIYPVSKLVDQLQNKVRVPTVLCYPGRREGQTGLVFLNLPGRDALGSYRVNIYG
jgi:hypothetical protein